MNVHTTPLHGEEGIHTQVFSAIGELGPCKNDRYCRAEIGC